MMPPLPPLPPSWQLALAGYIPMITGNMSIVGSSLIVYSILGISSSNRAVKLRKPRLRLLLGMSFWDIIYSFFKAWTFLFTPVGYGFPGAVAGNMTTCRMQGFFVLLAHCTAAYNALLSTYYWLTVSRGMKDEQWVKWEPFMHLGVAVLFCGLGTVGVVTRLYNVSFAFCFIAAYPPGCESGPDAPPCLYFSQAKTGLYYELFSKMFIQTFMIVVFATNFALWWSVHQQDKTMRRYDHDRNHNHNNNGRRPNNPQEQDQYYRHSANDVFYSIGSFRTSMRSSMLSSVRGSVLSSARSSARSSVRSSVHSSVRSSSVRSSARSGCCHRGLQGSFRDSMQSESGGGGGGVILPYHMQRMQQQSKANIPEEEFTGKLNSSIASRLEGEEEENDGLAIMGDCTRQSRGGDLLAVSEDDDEEDNDEEEYGEEGPRQEQEKQQEETSGAAADGKEEGAGRRRSSTGRCCARQVRRNRQVLAQCLLYSTCFFLSWIGPVMYHLLGWFKQYQSFTFVLVIVIFTPLQGFFNAFVYARPTFLRVRRKYFHVSRWDAAKRVFFAEDPMQPCCTCDGKSKSNERINSKTSDTHNEDEEENNDNNNNNNNSAGDNENNNANGDNVQEVLVLRAINEENRSKTFYEVSATFVEEVGELGGQDDSDCGNSQHSGEAAAGTEQDVGQSGDDDVRSSNPPLQVEEQQQQQQQQVRGRDSESSNSQKSGQAAAIAEQDLGDHVHPSNPPLRVEEQVRQEKNGGDLSHPDNNMQDFVVDKLQGNAASGIDVLTTNPKAEWDDDYDDDEDDNSEWEWIRENI